MRLSEASIEALDVLCALHRLDPRLTELQVALICAVVQKVNVSVNFETFKLQSLRVLSEHLRLRHYVCHVHACHLFIKYILKYILYDLFK